MLLWYSHKKSSDVKENRGCGRIHWNKPVSVARHESLQLQDIQIITSPNVQIKKKREKKVICFLVRLRNVHKDMSRWRICTVLCKISVHLQSLPSSCGAHWKAEARWVNVTLSTHLRQDGSQLVWLSCAYMTARQAWGIQLIMSGRPPLQCFRESVESKSKHKHLSGGGGRGVV